MAMLFKSSNTEEPPSSSYIVGVVEDWALTNCFYSLETAWRRFLSCLKYHLWKRHAGLRALNLMGGNRAPRWHFNHIVLWSKDLGHEGTPWSRARWGHWKCLPDHVEDSAFTDLSENVIVFLFSFSIFRGKTFLFLSFQVCPEQYDKGSRCI